MEIILRPFTYSRLQQKNQEHTEKGAYLRFARITTTIAMTKKMNSVPPTTAPVRSHNFVLSSDCWISATATKKQSKTWPCKRVENFLAYQIIPKIPSRSYNGNIEGINFKKGLIKSISGENDSEMLQPGWRPDKIIRKCHPIAIFPNVAPSNLQNALSRAYEMMPT